MARSTVRTVETYSIHGHVRPGDIEEELLDYASFFERLALAPRHDLRYPVGADTVAIADIAHQRGLHAFRFVTGNADEFPLVYDLATASAERINPGSERFVVNGAWAIVSPSDRLLFAERKRPGVPIYQMERFLTAFGREHLNMRDVSVSLNPVPSASFAEEIGKFTRIREASITLRRPNHSWTKSAESMLGELSESNAADVQLQLNANRGQSLSKNRGVVREIVALSQRPINALKNAAIKGIMPTHETERSVSLHKHTVKGSTRIDPSAGPQEQLTPLIEVAESLIRETSTSNANRFDESDRQS